jgi:hypothetical protein
MNLYKGLETAIRTLAAEFPDVQLEFRSLRGTRRIGDQLIVERRVGRGVRVVRIPAVTDSVRGFYWGILPPPGEQMKPEHGEGHSYGNVTYVLRFTRALLLELQDWKQLPRPDLDPTSR